MKRVLFDVNIVVDMVLQRAPFFAPAARLWAAAETGRLELFLPAHGVTTVFYVVGRARGRPFAQRVVSDLLLVPKIAAVDEAVLRRALMLGWRDFEDAVCASAAVTAGCDLLVSRDPKDFPDSPVPVMDPGTAAALLAGETGPGEVAEARASARHSIRRRRAR